MRSSAPNILFKNFSGDITTQIILTLQPAQVAGLTAYQGWLHKHTKYSIWLTASSLARIFMLQILQLSNSPWK